MPGTNNLKEKNFNFYRKKVLVNGTVDSNFNMLTVRIDGNAMTYLLDINKSLWDDRALIFLVKLVAGFVIMFTSLPV